MVIPYSPALTLYFLLICLAISMAMGAIVGVLASLSLRLPMHGIWKDALLSLLGFSVAFMALVFLGPLHTFVSSDEGLPLRTGLVTAAALPFLRELSRFIRTKRSRTATEQSPIK